MTPSRGDTRPKIYLFFVKLGLVLFCQLAAMSISPYERQLSRSFILGFDVVKYSQLARI